jgi:serine/threonine protein kinase
VTAGREFPVAVKILLKSQIITSDKNDDSFDLVRRAAWREARLLREVEARSLYQCVVRCYGVVEGVMPASFYNGGSSAEGSNNSSNDAIGIVMSLESGGSLDAMLFPKEGSTQFKKVIFLDMKEKLMLLAKIARGLAELHSMGLVHGDIKPHNILLSHHSPPDIRFSDFGLSKFTGGGGGSGSSNSSNGGSTLQQTKNVKGTPVYCAPEMLVNPYDESFCETVARPSRKTDMYAFAVMSWEILSRERALSECKTEAALCSKVHKGVRPSLDKLPADTPVSVVEMLTCCWDKDRRTRKLAVECHALLSSVMNMYASGKFDLFFSHAWVSKPLLSHVYSLLFKAGYRVWYDQNDMGHNMEESMRQGIERSTVVVACVSRHYQTRPNCMFELKEATICNKPILLLSLESDLMSWASDELKQLCQLNKNRNNSTIVDESDTTTARGSIVIDIGTVADAALTIINSEYDSIDTGTDDIANSTSQSKSADEETSMIEADPVIEIISEGIKPLFLALNDLNCIPSFNKANM